MTMNAHGSAERAEGKILHIFLASNIFKNDKVSAMNEYQSWKDRSWLSGQGL